MKFHHTYSRYVSKKLLIILSAKTNWCFLDEPKMIFSKDMFPLLGHKKWVETRNHFQMLYNGLGSVFFKEALQEKNSFINILFMFLLSNKLFNLQEKILLNCLHIFTYFTYVCVCVCSSVHTHACGCWRSTILHVQKKAHL